MRKIPHPVIIPCRSTPPLSFHTFYLTASLAK
jgi:hypothetical protein